jgi:hypothetical protein
MPWHVAQFAMKSFSPLLMEALAVVEVSADAVDVLIAAYAPPVKPSPIAMSATAASGCLRPLLRGRAALRIALGDFSRM